MKCAAGKTYSTLQRALLEQANGDEAGPYAYIHYTTAEYGSVCTTTGGQKPFFTILITLSKEIEAYKRMF